MPGKLHLAENPDHGSVLPTRPEFTQSRHIKPALTLSSESMLHFYTLLPVQEPCPASRCHPTDSYSTLPLNQLLLHPLPYQHNPLPDLKSTPFPAQNLPLPPPPLLFLPAMCPAHSTQATKHPTIKPGTTLISAPSLPTHTTQSSILPFPHTLHNAL